MVIQRKEALDVLENTIQRYFILEMASYLPKPPALTPPSQLLRPLRMRPHLIPLLRPRTGLRKIAMRLGIPQLLKLPFPQAVERRENRFALDIFQFGHPFADVGALRVALFRLRDGVEDGIGGLPAVGVVGQILRERVSRVNERAEGMDREREREGRLTQSTRFSAKYLSPLR